MEFETLIQKLKLVNSEAEITALLADSNTNYNDLFRDAARIGHIEVVSKILELAKDKISNDAIYWGFLDAAGNGHTGVVSKIWELASDKVSNDAIFWGFKGAASSGRTETLLKIWELASDKVSNNAIYLGFMNAAFSGHTETLLKIWELAKDKLSDDAILIGFEWAAENGHTETLLKIWELAKDKVSNNAISWGFSRAASRGHTETLLKIWELAKDKLSNETLFEFVSLNDKETSDEKMLKLVEQIKAGFSDADLRLLKIIKALKNNDDLQVKALAAELSDAEKKEICSKLLKNHSKRDIEEFIKKLLDVDLFAKDDNLKIIGFNNYVGEWSQSVIDYIKKDNHILVLSLDREDTENEQLLSIFDGFVNPGAHDTFPGPTAFDVSYLDSGKHSDHEYAYQNVINYAKANSIPYLGLCNGAQHLVLNSGGYIEKAATPHNGVPHTLKIELGTIVQFLAMNEQEQKLAITNGYFPEMEFLINTQHNYAGVKGKIGTLELGGLSDEGVVEAVAHKFYQVGFQFHPENMYYTMEDKVFGRNANLLKNTFKFFALDSKKVDLEKVHEYMYAELQEAFTNAVCIPNESNTCPAQEGLARDIFAEAIAIATNVEV